MAIIGRLPSFAAKRGAIFVNDMKRDRCLQFYEDTAHYNQVNALARDGGALVIHDQSSRQSASL